jgi:Trypsin-like peptidase domain
MRPLSTIALVCHTPTAKAEGFVVEKLPVILGTCFAFRRSNFFLTTHHVIKSLDRCGLAIWFLTTPGLRVVTQVHAHPTADVAILEAVDIQTGTIEPFWDIVSNIHLGETLAAFGFPDDLVRGESGGSPHRLFMGHYQRFTDYESFMAYRCVVGALNIPCPAGLSGGPLFRPEAPQMLTALATENVETSTWPESIEEEVRDGGAVRTTPRRIISYGVSVILFLLDWINEFVPRPEPAPWLTGLRTPGRGGDASTRNPSSPATYCALSKISPTASENRR